MAVNDVVVARTAGHGQAALAVTISGDLFVRYSTQGVGKVSRTESVLRRPIESANYTSAPFAETLRALAIRQSVGRTGVCLGQRDG